MSEAPDGVTKSSLLGIRKPVETQTGIKFFGLKNRRELARESLRDGLTGLWNKKGWELKLGDLENLSKRTGQPLTYISCDLDELKNVNDTEGHIKGDDLIKRAAEGLKKSIRTTDLLARVGGDEFFIALPNTDLGGAEQVKNKIMNNLIGIQISVGSGITLTDADFAMFEVKKLRKNE